MCMPRNFGSCIKDGKYEEKKKKEVKKEKKKVLYQVKVEFDDIS